MTKEKILKILKNTAAIIVIAAMFIIIFYQNRDRDIFKFGREESNRFLGVQGEITSSGHLNSSVSSLGNEVFYLTTNSFGVLDENFKGESVSVSLSDPMLHSEGEYALCYNKNSLDITVFKREREYCRISTENRILRAKVNANGYTFVATEKEGYNCECIVYNRSGEAIFKWDISKSEFLDGDISFDNKSIALSVATAGEESLLGEIILIDATEAEIIGRKSFESQLFYSVDFNKNGTYTALGSECLAYFNPDSTCKWSYSYDKKALLKADITNPDMMVLAFSEAGSGIKGNSTDVKVLNRLGKITAERSFDGLVDDIAVSKDALAAVFGRTVYITDSALSDKKTVKSETSIKKIALFDDNKHLFVIGNSETSIIK